MSHVESYSLPQSLRMSLSSCWEWCIITTIRVLDPHYYITTGGECRWETIIYQSGFFFWGKEVCLCFACVFFLSGSVEVQLWWINYIFRVRKQLLYYGYFLTWQLIRLNVGFVNVLMVLHVIWYRSFDTTVVNCLGQWHTCLYSIHALCRITISTYTKNCNTFLEWFDDNDSEYTVQSLI